MIAEDVSAIENFNEILRRLSKRRLQKISAEGPLAKSKLAWKVSAFQQPILYRLVMLANGCALNWNESNVLCCVLAVRSLIETFAVVHEFEHDLSRHVESGDLTEIDMLVINRSFATRDEELSSSLEGTQAINVQTFIDKLDRRLLKGMRSHYDFLSEFCHPNSYGHHQLFGVLDKENRTINYIPTGRKSELLSHILIVHPLLGLVENALQRIDEAILKISTLEDANDPYNWKV